MLLCALPRTVTRHTRVAPSFLPPSPPSPPPPPCGLSLPLPLEGRLGERDLGQGEKYLGQ